MKAIVYTTYGSPDVLTLKEVEKPVPKENQVLVKVHAASVNSWDWDLVTGRPLVYRLLFGLFKPKYKVIGSDIAGTVEAVGKNVGSLKQGDEVFGDISAVGFGAFAEYSCVDEKLLALKPATMSFEEAAALPQAGVLALQGLRQGKIGKGQKILINGAGGGVGTFAIQMAKLWGAEVTAVDHTNKLDSLRSIGANHVIDYTVEDFTKNGQRYNMILDVIAKRSLKDYKNSLIPGGSFVLVGGSIATILATAIFGGLSSGKSNNKLGLLMHKPNKEDLDRLKDFFEQGKLKPVIDKRYSLNKTAEAVRYLGEGKALGKVIVSM